MMKPGGIILCLLIVISCTYEGIAPVKLSPTRELHYDMETGEKLAEKIFTYDADGRLIEEKFTHKYGSISYEAYYEYDADGNLVKERKGNPAPFEVKEYTYTNGRKTMMESHWESSAITALNRVTYFYSASDEADSSRHDVYLRGVFQPKSSSRRVYAYDDQGRLTTEFVKPQYSTPLYGRIEYLYYFGNSVSSLCNVNGGYEGGGEYTTCTVNEFDRNGQMVKSSYYIPDAFKQLQEQYFYKNGILEEKWLYSYPGYSATDTLDITQVKFEY